MTDLHALRRLQGSPEDLRRALADALRARGPHADDHAAWARLAESFGALDLARQEWQRALAAQHPDARAALDALQRTLADAPLTPAPPQTPLSLPARSPDHLTAPTPADLSRFVHRFSGREDVHARQWFDAARGRGGYSPVPQPLSPSLIHAHLQGRLTLGVYPVRLDATVTFFALDLDATRAARDAARVDADRTRALRRLLHDAGLHLQRRAQDLGLPLLLEESGYKGRHLWGFLREPLPADLVWRFVRALAHHLRPDHRALHLEAFPKQGRVDPDRLGNLIKLPLGFHQVTRRRAWVLDPHGLPLHDPWPTLRDLPTLTRPTLLDAFSALGDPPDPTPDAPSTPPEPVPFPDDPQLRQLLAGCPVAAALVQRAREQRRLDHAEVVVLTHSLGHLPAGVQALTHLFQQCPEIPTRAYPQRILRGHPISCPKVRQRVPHLTAHVACHCDFSHHPTHYPSPLLHAHGAPPCPSSPSSPPAPR